MYKQLPLALAAALAIAGAASLTACSDAQVASSNRSKAADNFEINRRIVFFNGITGEYMLSIEGLCSIGSATKTKVFGETYIFDFDKDIYGSWVSVRLLKKIRGSKKFGSKEELVEYIKRDVAEANEYFKKFKRSR